MITTKCRCKRISKEIDNYVVFLNTKNFISGIGRNSAHTSSDIDNSIAKFRNLSSSNFKLLIDPTQSNVDNITGIETHTAETNTFKNNISDLNSTASNIFNEHLLENRNNQEFVSHLYEEVLQREPESIGMNYWLGQLNSGAGTRYEVLLGFSQSAESTTLFTDMTGLG